MSSKPSKAALARHLAAVIDQDGHQLEAAPADLRVAGLRELVPETVDAAVVDLIGEVFSRTGLARDQAKVSYIASLRASVGLEWQRAGKAFLRIGRLLLEAEQKLSKAEYDSLIEGAGRLLPFGRTVAIQLRRVAQAVDARRLPEEHCPASYSVAYALVTLPDEFLRLAGERNLVRPDVKREEVRAFKAEVLASQHTLGAEGRVDLRDLRRELELLRQQKRVHLDKLISIRRRMQEIARLVR